MEVRVNSLERADSALEELSLYPSFNLNRSNYIINIAVNICETVVHVKWYCVCLWVLLDVTV